MTFGLPESRIFGSHIGRLLFEFGVLLWFDTQRRACILPGSRTTSCPSAPLETGQRDTGHTHLRSIRPLLPVLRRDRSHWSFPIAPRTSDRKSHLWHLESCLCASLCGCSCARRPRMKMLEGEALAAQAPFRRQPLHPVRIAALYVHMGVDMLIMFAQRGSASFSLTQAR